MAEQLIVRNLPDGTIALIKERAASAGQSQEEWLRQQIATALATPTVRVVYGLKAIGPDGARATIKRGYEGLIGQGAENMSPAQSDAYRDAKLLVERNAPGDRERAIGLLSSVFEDVFEVSG